MSKDCETLHKLFNGLKKMRFPFNEEDIPENGVYILFENGEKAHDGDRIVRVGTHTGQNQLRSRLRQHFINENKDRSIFRKNIGRAIINKSEDNFLEQWEIDLTTAEARQKFSDKIDFNKQNEIEKKVTEYLQNNFSFVVIEISDKKKRLEFESKIISTISICKDCKPSNEWLGLFSPKDKIKESGLWLVNELYKTPITDEELDELSNFIKSK